MSDDRPQARTLETADLLREATQRAVPIELHRHERNGTVSVAKARLIFDDERNLYLDDPQAIGTPLNFEFGQEVAVFFWLYDTLFTFNASVVAAHCVINLNSRKQVKGIALTRPAQIRKGQRRGSYRISIAASLSIPAILHEADMVEGSACPMDARRWSNGKVVDLSLGGMSVMFDREPPHHFRVGRSIFVGFTLPLEDREVIALSEIRQIRPLHDGASCRLGLAFLPWPHERHFRANVEQVMQRFIAKLERQTLRRAG